MRNLISILSIFFAFSLSACSGTESTVNTESGNGTSPSENINFAKGADVSWLTEMEASGVRFYDSDGKPAECLVLLRRLGINAIRLRVWVDPTDGWNGKEDVIKKAVRAHNLGFRLMIDFHYSDTWADPGKQNIPAAWQTYDLTRMKQAVAMHTQEVLQALRDKGVSVEWVQVGNETATGMLWEVGRYSDSNQQNFAQLVTSGYEAVKKVFPAAKVIVHVDQGDKLGRFTWLFDGLKKQGAKWDVIGMSLYPEPTTWQQQTNDCLTNIKTLSQRYGCEVMVVEVGMSWDAVQAEAFMRAMTGGAKNIPQCLGVFYWEPQCYGGWKGYTKGAFDKLGKPTAAFLRFAAD